LDLFKQAPTSFQGRIQHLVNEILQGRYDCDLELLMANVILISECYLQDGDDFILV